MVDAPEVYNLLQDFRSLSLVVDVRGRVAFSAGHVDGAELAGLEPRKHVLQRFADINVQSGGHEPFTLCLCCEGGPASEPSEAGCKNSQRALQEYAAAAHQYRPFRLQRVLAFTYAEYRQRFPFTCSDLTGFEPSRIYPSCVAERLFLGHWALASDPFVVKSCLGATHVVNCTPEHPCCFQEDGLQYLRVPVADEQSADLLSHLEGAVAFVSDALDSGAVVLLHCKHGQSRSAAVAAACLVRRNGWSLDRSMAHLRECRPRVKPNPGFMQQLESFEASTAQRVAPC